MLDVLATATPQIWTNSGAPKDRPTLVRLTPDSLTLAAVSSADVVIAGAVLVGVGLLLFALVMLSPPINIVVEPADQSDSLALP